MYKVFSFNRPNFPYLRIIGETPMGIVLCNKTMEFSTVVLYIALLIHVGFLLKEVKN